MLTRCRRAAGVPSLRRLSTHAAQREKGEEKGGRESKWSSQESRRKFMDTVAARYEVREAKDWRRVRTTDVVAMGGGGLLSRYSKSLLRALEDIYPELEFSATECRPSLPPGYWQDAERRRNFLEKIAKEKNVKEKSDWRRVSTAHVRQEGGAALLAMYQGSMHRLLTATFPEANFTVADCMAKLPKGHWDVPANVVAFLRATAHHFSVTSPGDWKRVTYDAMADLGGATLLKRHKSVSCLLEYARGLAGEAGEVPGLGEEVTATDVRSKVPKGYWKSVGNRRLFMDKVAAAHGVKEAADWRRVRYQDVADMGGAYLLSLYPTLYDALRDIYGEEGGDTWDVFSCRSTMPQGGWTNAETVRTFMEKVRRQLDVREKEDWYRVSRQHVCAMGGGALLNAMSLTDALRLAYPDETWDDAEVRKRVKKASQWQLHKKTARLFPGMEVREDHRHEALNPAARNAAASLELDIFVPQLDLALEYQGQHHYHEQPFFGPIEQYQRRDKEKRELCKASGIRLVEIPYWWDMRIESLAATLAAHFPGILPEAAAVEKDDPELAAVLRAVADGKHEAISPDLPSLPVPAGRGGDKQAALRILTPSACGGQLVAPRYDGLDVYWTGTELALRSGRVLSPPSWWTAALPDMEVDGVLHGTDGSVGRMMRVLFLESPLDAYMPERVETADEKWRHIRLVAYDTPHTSLPLAERLKVLRSHPESGHFAVARHEEVEKGETHLQQLLDRAVAEGAGSVLLRDATAAYSYSAKGEPRVRKMYSGLVRMVEKAPTTRGLLVQTPSGTVQVVRCSGREYGQPPAAGSVLAVQHFGKWATGRLKFPFLVGVRHDLSWEECAKE